MYSTTGVLTLEARIACWSLSDLASMLGLSKWLHLYKITIPPLSDATLI